VGEQRSAGEEQSGARGESPPLPGGAVPREILAVAVDSDAVSGEDVVGAELVVRSGISRAGAAHPQLGARRRPLERGFDLVGQKKLRRQLGLVSLDEHRYRPKGVWARHTAAQLGDNAFTPQPSSQDLGMPGVRHGAQVDHAQRFSHVATIVPLPRRVLARRAFLTCSEEMPISHYGSRGSLPI
jgi:hypothetical protein